MEDTLNGLRAHIYTEVWPTFRTQTQYQWKSYHKLWCTTVWHRPNLLSNMPGKKRVDLNPPADYHVQTSKQSVKTSTNPNKAHNMTAETQYKLMMCTMPAQTVFTNTKKLEHNHPKIQQKLRVVYARVPWRTNFGRIVKTTKGSTQQRQLTNCLE